LRPNHSGISFCAEKSCRCYEESELATLSFTCLERPFTSHPLSYAFHPLICFNLSKILSIDFFESYLVF